MTPTASEMRQLPRIDKDRLERIKRYALDERELSLRPFPGDKDDPYTYLGQLVNEVECLVAEVERLRKLVKEAEWRSYREYPEDQTCPWCDAGATEGMHRNDCPAFTVDGVVK